MVFMITFYPLILLKCDIINYVIQNMPFGENLFSLGKKIEKGWSQREHDFLIPAYREAAIYKNKNKERKKGWKEKKGKGEKERKTGERKVEKRK